MTLDANGNFAVGANSAADSAAIATFSGVSTVLLNASGSLLRFNKTAGTDTGWLSNRSYSWHDGNGLALSTQTADPLRFGTNGSERARIDSSGNLLVAKTAVGVAVGCEMQANGIVSAVRTGSDSSTSSFQLYSTGASAYRFYVGMQGTVYATSTTITGISDQRLKENIVDLDVGLDAILSLKPRKFDWKEGKGKDIKNDRGFIAQEFEQVFPDLIDTWKDEQPEGEEPYKAVRPDLIPVIVKAIQELTQRLEALEAK